MLPLLLRKGPCCCYSRLAFKVSCLNEQHFIYSFVASLSYERTLGWILAIHVLTRAGNLIRTMQKSQKELPKQSGLCALLSMFLLLLFAYLAADAVCMCFRFCCI
jgi:Na+/proline symporter